MKDDWAKDSCGQKTMSEMAFNKCMFELTDLWVEGVDASDYADFLTAIADAITAWRNPGGGDEGRWMGWRFDEETLDNLTLLVKLPRELERRSSFSNSPGAARRLVSARAARSSSSQTSPMPSPSSIRGRPRTSSARGGGRRRASRADGAVG